MAEIGQDIPLEQKVSGISAARELEGSFMLSIEITKNYIRRRAEESIREADIKIIKEQRGGKTGFVFYSNKVALATWSDGVSFKAGHFAMLKSFVWNR